MHWDGLKGRWCGPSRSPPRGWWVRLLASSPLVAPLLSGCSAAFIMVITPIHLITCFDVHSLFFFRWNLCAAWPMRTLYRSENNSPKEPQVGVMRSDLNELSISPACAVLQPRVRTSEYSCLRQTWTQDWIASTRFRPMALSTKLCGLFDSVEDILVVCPLYYTFAMLSEELLAFMFCYYMQTTMDLCLRCNV